MADSADAVAASRAAPNKEQRRICWEARDQVYECLDKHSGDEAKCQEQRSKMTAVCPCRWVTYFDRQYNYRKYKKKLEKEGLQEWEDGKEKR